MTYRWFRWWTILTLPLVVSPFVLGGMLFVEAYTENPERIVASLPVFFLSIAVAYSSLAYLVNITSVTIEDDLVTVRHGPIPWKGKAYRLIDCEQFSAGKIQETRFTVDGIRIRFSDDSYENLSYASSEAQAQAWAKELNKSLKAYQKSIALSPEREAHRE